MSCPLPTCYCPLILIQTVIDNSYLIPLLPLIGALIAGLFGAKYLKGQSHWPIWLGVGASAVLSLWLLVDMIGHSGHGPIGIPKDWFSWISLGYSDVPGSPAKKFEVPFGFYFDPLT